MNAKRTLVSRSLLATLTALIVAAVVASSANAAAGHALSRSIGLTGSGTLTGVGGVVARSASGDLFAADPGGKVWHYDQTGDPIGSIDTSSTVASPAFLAYDPSSQDLYVGGSDAMGVPVLARYDVASGAAVPTVDLTQAGVTGLSGVAADSQGRLYVGDNATSTVQVFDAAGDPVTSFDGSEHGGTKFDALGPVAVDRHDDVYVVQRYGTVQKFAPAGADFRGVVGPDRSLDIAIDPADDDLYVVDSPDGATFGITHYLAGGGRESRFAEDPNAGSITGLSVGSASHTLFVGNPIRPAVDVYRAITVPDVATGTPPTGIETDSATVTGTVNPRGDSATTTAFDYGVDSSYGSTSTEQTFSGSTGQTASGALTDLRPNTVYHYRLRATTSDNRTNLGPDRTFTTAAAPPTVGGESATAITTTSATLNATVNPHNKPSSARFQYWIDPANRSLTPPVDTGAGDSDATLTADLASLQPDTTYHYRVLATNGVGTGTQGTEQTFKTLPLQPLAAIGSATFVGGDAAQLTGTVDTQGLAGSASFLVQARNSTYSVLVPAGDLPTGTGSRAVSATVSGLPSGGTFSVRVRVRTTTSTVFSEPTTFATPYVAAPAPPAALTFDAFPYPSQTAPSNRFSASASVKGSTGTVALKVPGRGAVSVSGRNVAGSSAHPSRAGTVRLKVRLDKRGRSLLRKARSKRLRVKVAVRYRPSGGTTRTGYRTLTFRR